MNVVFISTDAAIITDPKGQSLERQLRYARYFEKLLVIILCLNSPSLNEIKLGNLTIIPTNSSSRWFYFFDCLKVIRKNMPIHLISAQSPFMEGLIGVVAKILWGIKLNIQLHIDLYRSSYFRKESLQNFFFWILSYLTLGMADSIRLGSRGLMNSPKAFRAVVPMRLDFFWNLPRRFRKFNQIVTVGRLVSQKNLGLLICVAKELKKDFPKLRFVIVGSGPEMNSLQSQIKKNSLSSNMHLVGWKSQLEYRDIFLKSDLYISTSNYEGWGMAITEAIASGLPVVITNTGQVGDLVEDNKVGGLVCKQNDVNGIASSVKRLLNDQKLSQGLVKKAQQRLRSDYTEEKLASDFIKGLLGTI